MPTARYIDSLKNPRIPGFAWPEPQDEHDPGLFRGILEWGCVLFSNDARNGYQEHSYSVGLYLNFLHPEILVTGLSRETCHAAMLKIRQEIEAGRTFRDGDEQAHLFELRHPVRFVTASEDHFHYVDYAAWFYRSLFLKAGSPAIYNFPVLQAVWADKNGYYPDDPRCHEAARRAQTLIE